ncbi:MAG: TIGR04283 family arsenosugar biosynthesis glycosyltransferase [Deltaproteobacteria bacterium]|nr:TIGR04283 family arsenosugar biosynthesis glycosyltransferase [Deltaproteobacteria bacterium]
MKFSVIIPALNEAGNLKGAIASAGPNAEIIVADGGSTDETRQTARELGAIVIKTPAGRGLQMDSAALHAKGEVLLFLHADSRLPEGWQNDIAGALTDQKVAGGGFRLRIDSPGKGFRLIERIANLRGRFLGLIYGDQAIFARREIFFSAGGFNKLPLMEDVDCVKRLSKLGKVVLLDKEVRTSPRRWDKGGVIRNTFWNITFLSLYKVGIPPKKLYGWYYGNKASN